VLAPLALVVGLLLASQGVPSTWQGGVDVPTLEQPDDGTVVTQHIPLGPIAPMVAIKQLLCQEHTPERMEELLRQEASLLNKLRHKNIIEFKAACISPPRFCIVLEFAALGTLSKHIRNTLDPCKAGFGSGCLLPCAWGETASLRVHPFHSW
jgi:hypothetical protein